MKGVLLKYQKKPVVVEAVQYDGVNLNEVAQFLQVRYCTLDQKNDILINTLEGTMHASPNDWIIKGVKGEYYPCKPDIFEETYEPVPE